MNKVELKIKSLFIGLMEKIIEKELKNLKKEVRKNQPIIPEIDSSSLHRDFNNAKQRIMENNSKDLIYNKYIPEVIKDTLNRDNYLMTELDALKVAAQRFIQDKQNGLIDELNCYRG